MASNSEVASPAAPMDALARSVTGNRAGRLSVPVTGPYRPACYR